MNNKEGLIQVLQGVIQEIEAGELKVEEIEKIHSIELQQNNHTYKEDFTLSLEGYYKN